MQLPELANRAVCTARCTLLALGTSMLACAGGVEAGEAADPDGGQRVDASTQNASAAAAEPIPCATAAQLDAIGGTFAFEGDPAEGEDPEVGFEVWVRGAPSWETRLVAGGLGFDGHQSWSPDGTQLVYQSNQFDAGDLFVINADGSGRRVLLMTDDEEAYPRWLPEGIVYRRGAAQRLIDPETGEEEAFDIGQVGGWTRSPDGQQLVVAKGLPTHLFLAEPDGTVIEQLTDQCATENHPVWAPSASLVAYSCGDGTRDGEWDVHLIDVETRQVTRVTDNPGPDWAGQWVLDGEWLLINSMVAGNWDVYLIRPDGTERTRVSCHRGRARAGAWTPATPLP